MQKNCELIPKERGWEYDIVILTKERGWGSFNISKTQGPLGNVCDTNRQVGLTFSSSSDAATAPSGSTGERSPAMTPVSSATPSTPATSPPAMTTLSSQKPSLTK